MFQKSLLLKQEEIQLVLKTLQLSWEGIKEPQRALEDSKIEEQEAISPAEEVLPIYSLESFLERILLPGDHLKQGQRVAILGGAGVGKTWISQSLASWVLTQTEDFPVWISLAALGKKSLAQYFQEDWLNEAKQSLNLSFTQSHDVLSSLLKSGRLWLFLDGVDQMSLAQIGKVSLFAGVQGERNRILTPFASLVKQLRGWGDQMRVIVTGKLNATRDDLDTLKGFDLYQVLGLRYWETSQPLIHYEFRDHPVFGETLCQALETPGKERLQTPLNSPQRLKWLCRLWKQGLKTLPSSSTGLYQQFITEFYRDQAQQYSITLEQQQQLTTILGQLAIKAFSLLSEDLPLNYRLVEAAFANQATLLGLAVKLGWLKPIGITAEIPNETIYAFCDPDFQAYFAALAIDEAQFFLSSPEYRIFDPAWKAVILLWLGREDISPADKEAFLAALLQFQDHCTVDNLYGKRAYFLAVAALSEFPKFSRRDDLVEELIRWGFGYFDSRAQVWKNPISVWEETARTTLLESYYPSVITALIPVIESPISEEKKREALAILEKIGQGNAVAIAALEQFIQVTPSNRICCYAAESLGKIDPGNSIALATLLTLLGSNFESETSQQVLTSLEKIAVGNREAITALVQLIQRTDAMLIQKRAFQSLEQIGRKNLQAIQALEQFLTAMETPRLQRQAAESLEKIDPGNPKAIASLIHLLQLTHQDEIRRQAVYSLGEVQPGNRAAIGALVQLLTYNEDVVIQWLALSSLGKIGKGNPEAIAAIVQIITSTGNLFLYKDAIENLGKIDPSNSSAIAALEKLLQEKPDESTLQEVAYHLGTLDPGNPHAIATLVQLLDSTEDEFTCRQAAESLGKIDLGNLAAISALVRLLCFTEDPDIRSLAAESLGKIGEGNPEVIAALIKLLQLTQDKETCTRTIVSLGQVGIGNQAAIDALIHLLISTNYEVNRFQAVESLIPILQKHQIPSVVTALKETLSDAKQWDLATQQLLWYCVNHLPYSDFYQAWHYQPLPPQTLREDQSEKQSSSDLAQWFKKNLPENLQLNKSLHLLYIESCLFFDLENPTIDIYDQMLNQGFPASSDWLPDTFSKLRLHWNIQRRNHPDLTFVLLFFENSQDTRNQEVNWLEQLSKFEGAIGVVTEKTIPNLQKFAPHQPQLTENILSWLQKIASESRK
jgi:HEAT repeat protein